MKQRAITQSMVDAYGFWLYQNEKSPATVRKYHYYLTLFCRYAAGRVLDKKMVMEWKVYLKKQMAPATVNGALAALNGLLRHQRWDDCAVKLVRVKQCVFYPEQKELTREEYARMVRTAEQTGNERMAMLLRTICVTGIRISELRFITVESLEKRAVKVDCKGKIRTVFLTERLCRLLRQYAGRHGIKEGMLFITRTGKAMDRSNIWREMKKLGELAGVTGAKVFPHNLRRLFARTYYSQEKDLLRLSDILGHSNINTTRIYTMESGGNHMRQLERMELLIEPEMGEYNGIPLLL